MIPPPELANMLRVEKSRARMIERMSRACCAALKGPGVVEEEADI